MRFKNPFHPISFITLKKNVWKKSRKIPVTQENPLLRHIPERRKNSYRRKACITLTRGHTSLGNVECARAMKIVSNENVTRVGCCGADSETSDDLQSNIYKYDYI